MTHHVFPKWLSALRKTLFHPFARVNTYSGVDKAPQALRRGGPRASKTPQTYTIAKMFICYFELDSILVTGRHYSEMSGSNVTNKGKGKRVP
jgi:hypothetical protein